MRLLSERCRTCSTEAAEKEKTRREEHEAGDTMTRSQVPWPAAPESRQRLNFSRSERPKSRPRAVPSRRKIHRWRTTCFLEQASPSSSSNPSLLLGSSLRVLGPSYHFTADSSPYCLTTFLQCTTLQSTSSSAKASSSNDFGKRRRT